MNLFMEAEASEWKLFHRFYEKDGRAVLRRSEKGTNPSPARRSVKQCVAVGWLYEAR